MGEIKMTKEFEQAIRIAYNAGKAATVLHDIDPVLFPAPDAGAYIEFLQKASG
jgi:hypothetical protein